MSSIDIKLDRKEALVLFEWLATIADKDLPVFSHEAERFVIWGIEAQLEKAMVEAFHPDYLKMLDDARRSIANQ